MDAQQNNNTGSVINFKDLRIQIWKNRWYIIKVAAIFIFIGLIIAISIPREYTSTVKFAPEGTKTAINGNMSDLAAIAGVNLDLDKPEAINMLLYPDVINSTPFLTELVSLPVTGSTIKDNVVSIYDYIDHDIKKPWWNLIFSAPFKWLNNVLTKEDPEASKKLDPYRLTRKQELVINTFKERVLIEIDKRKSIILVSITMQDPQIAAQVADSLVSKLEKYMILYRTTKARQDYEFAGKMYQDARQKYFVAQKNYARYVDENKNVILKSVQVEEERLRNELTFAYNMYSNLAQQSEAKKMKIQEQTPFVAIIEPARVPSGKSNMGRMSIVLTFAFLGFIFGIGYIFFRKIMIKRNPGHI